MANSDDRRLTEELAELMWRMVGQRNYCEWHGFWGVEKGIPRIVGISQDVFLKFTKEYQVRRNIGDLAKFRDETIKHFSNDKDHLINMSSSLTGLAERLNCEEVTRGRCKSLLTKVAAFGWPERFVAMDKFAKKGIRKSFKVYGCTPPTGSANEIENYWEWVAKVRKNTKDTCRKTFKRLKTEDLRFEAFHNRIIDLYLMSLGGRFKYFSQKERNSDDTCKEVCIFNHNHPWRRGAFSVTPLSRT